DIFTLAAVNDETTIISGRNSNDIRVVNGAQYEGTFTLVGGLQYHAFPRAGSIDPGGAFPSGTSVDNTIDFTSPLGASIKGLADLALRGQILAGLDAGVWTVNAAATGTPKSGRTWTLTLGGTDYSYAANDGDTLSAVNSGLATAISGGGVYTATLVGDQLKIT